MTEPSWKVVVDGDRVTISSAAYTFTTSGTDPMHLETVVADLQSAVRRTYGQYCGLSRAAEMVGAPWGFLIVRDLITGPKSAEDLRAGLPRLSESLLARRLKELAYSGIVQALDEDADGPVRYELTEYGRALEDTVLAFARWGATSLAEPLPDEIVTDSTLMVALKATFLPEAAKGVRVTYELRIVDHVLGVRVDDGVLEIAAGPLPGADAVLDLGGALLALMTGELTAEDVLSAGQVRVDGDPALLGRFTAMFRLPMIPAPRSLARQG